MEKTIIKECQNHGETVFVLRNDNRYRCRKCAIDSVVKRRKKIKKMSVEYKGGKCEICGYDKCLRALEFHHTDPAKKDFQISGKSVSWERIKNELDKCVLVCSNCHSEIHSDLDEE